VVVTPMGPFSTIEEVNRHHVAYLVLQTVAEITG
jgi:hypothetical protein